MSCLLLLGVSARSKQKKSRLYGERWGPYSWWPMSPSSSRSSKVRAKATYGPIQKHATSKHNSGVAREKECMCPLLLRLWTLGWGKSVQVYEPPPSHSFYCSSSHKISSCATKIIPSTLKCSASFQKPKQERTDVFCPSCPLCTPLVKRTQSCTFMSAMSQRMVDERNHWARWKNRAKIQKTTHHGLGIALVSRHENMYISNLWDAR